ncbi:MAG: hypothetical protein ABSE49_06095 [Polyangiaceae bacterium]
MRGRTSIARVALAGLGLGALVGGAGVSTSACSNSDDTAGLGGYVFADGGTGGSTNDAVIASEGGGAVLKAFAYPPDPGGGAFYVTISGESNAYTGYPFPPDNFSADTYMPDGWQFEILEYLVVVDQIVLWSDPDKSITDQSQHGAQIAHLDGPFVVDLHKGGKIVGQGGYPELATPLGSITSQNDNGNASFDTSGGTRYGFGFSTVPATYDAYNVNLDDSESADFALMVANGYTVFYRGMAVWKGDDPANPYPCEQTAAGPGNADGGGYDFSAIDELTFSFALGFPTPTNYVNCQNMTGGGTPLQGEDYARGVYASPSQSSIAQVTIHMDHPFWESFQEDSPVHWDNIAAQYVGSTQNPVPVRTEDFIGVGFHPWFDGAGTPLPWRNCVGSYYSPPGNGQMFFSTLSVPIDPSAECTGTIGVDYKHSYCPAIRDYYDYIRYTQSTQGHLNSQGLCYIDRQFPSPAGGS